LKFSSRQTINTSILLLAMFVLVLAGIAGWQSWQKYNIAKDVSLVNSIADKLIDVASIEALERGVTALAMGRSEAPSEKLMQRVVKQRIESDEKWKSIIDLTTSLTSAYPHSIVSDKLDKTKLAYAEIVSARRLIDDCLGKRPCKIDAQTWIVISSGFISKASLLRESIFLPLDTPQHMAELNVSIKRWLWLINEYATRERAILSYYIAANKPVPAEQLDELKSLRGVVDRNLEDLMTIKELRYVDPRISAAIEHLEDVFVNQYEEKRKQVYKSTISGNYPFDALEWMKTATPAIDSVKDLTATVSAVADESAAKVMEKSRYSLFLHIILILFTLIITFISVRKVRETSRQLFHQKELAEVTLSSIGDAVITTDEDARIVYLNPVAEQMTGWSVSEAQGLPIAKVFNIINGLTYETIPSPVEACLRDNRVVGVTYNTILVSRKGIETYIEDSAAPITDYDGNVRGGVLVFYDVNQSRHANQLLSYHSTHDALTGLVNRREFERRLSGLIARSANGNEQHALLYIDLDQLKLINDTYGHALGDKMIYEIGHILAEKISEADCLARIGGNEFGLLIESCTEDMALGVAETLRQSIETATFEWNKHKLDIHISIGLVPFQNGKVTPATLLSKADAACFVAKELGRNRIKLYQSTDMDMARRHSEMQWVPKISKALAENRFVLYYQPIVPLQIGEQHGELLIRLIDEDGNVISPADFIPAAERYDLMPSIDRWVIANALKSISNYLATARSSTERWSINLSGVSLGEDGIKAFILNQFKIHRVPAAAICFEITETAAVSNLSDARALILGLKEVGCTFALDDFGSGLSSFMYLKNLPVDYLKIDGSFVRNILEDSVSYAMVQSINTIGHTMGIRTVAEYVENDKILASLKKMGVDYAQGFELGRPIPFSDYLSNK
jgi:diguanylate cyclase (GGDEF)-like protein/PAS domain S-box-containing protein